MPNLLAGETSPYLLQHAANPVDWHPWNEQTLALARRLDRPILLSIGYSACHWCHVMAHESFEQAETAATMNRLFINIKVDREERPDLDQLYQSAQQLLTGRPGGWPLTMFLTPAGLPFHGGTYFPPTPRYGLPGFTDLLEQVAKIFAERRADIDTQNQQLLGHLAASLPTAPSDAQALDARPLAAAQALLAQNFDPRWGGFGGAPKFPPHGELELLLRRHAASGDEQALHMATLTLRRMAEGGLFDQLGGGFARYSVDATWTIPHFEKMLYDNGQLLARYADAWVATGEQRYADVAAATADWLLREMQAPEGGFYASRDADSEGEEGRFYLWTAAEAQALIAAADWPVVARHWGLDGPANAEHAHWQLRVAVPLAQAARETGGSDGAARQALERARSALFAARERRPRPGRDEKILTAWNALAIHGLLRAARVFNRPDWLAAARRALDFIAARLRMGNGQLLAGYKDGRAHLDAYLDDHAFLLAALLEALQADFRPADLACAQALADALLTRFADDRDGGFFFTASDHEPLIHRSKPGHDHATPAGNGVAAFALQRLALITGEARYASAASRTLQLFQGELRRSPAACAALLRALEEHLLPPTLIILRGPAGEVAAWQHALLAGALPGLLQHSLLLALPNGGPPLPASLARPESATVNAWVCCGVNCLPPIASLEMLFGEVSKPRKVL